MCGFIQSTFVTVPVNVIGLFRSNSADTAWCANAGTSAASRAEPKMKTPTRFRAIDPPINLNIAIETRLLTPVPLKSSPLIPDLLQSYCWLFGSGALPSSTNTSNLGATGGGPGGGPAG